MRIAFDLTTAQGIGDAVTGLYAATGLAQAGHSVVLSTRHHAWLAGCLAPVGIGDFGKAGLDASVRYNEQLVAQKNALPGMSRARWYIENIATARGSELRGILPAVPEFRFPLEKPPVPNPYVVLSPFSAHTERVWRADQWGKLAAELVAAGITPVAVGSARDARWLQQIFRSVKGAWFFWHQTPSWVRSTMRQSLGFVGNDSGMTHIAASLGVPVVAIMSHLRPEFVFSPGKVTGVVPDMARFGCRFCGWQKEQGFRFAQPCLPVCNALQSISVSAVLEAVQQTCLNQTHAIAA
jgi:hypothetical protein